MVSDKEGKMTNISRYYNGHIYNLYQKQTLLLKEISIRAGGLTEEDFKNLELFAERIIRI